jgi:hypothetical protein
MREIYPAAVAQLADLFQLMSGCDRECSRINGSAPPGDHRRLRRVELTARGVEGPLQPNVYIAEMLQLPFFWRDSGPIYAWPPPTPPVFAPSVVLPGPGPDWQAEIAARNEAQRKESERVAAFYARQEAEREEREAAEARAANERQIERRRREGWPI